MQISYTFTNFARCHHASCVVNLSAPKRGEFWTTHQMSTTQLGALDRIVSDMTFAPDCPIPFPCKLWKMKGLPKATVISAGLQ